MLARPDAATYGLLFVEYDELGALLAARRSRARNALVHGNATRMEVVDSVRSISRACLL